MSREHRTYFNELAPRWHLLMPELPQLGEWLASFGISNGDRILDIGAGTGRSTSILARLAGSAGRVYALDVAERMLAEGRKIMPQDNVRCLCADAAFIPLKTGAVDKILAFSAFPHIRDKETAAWEMARVLEPGGRLLILHATSSVILNAFHASLDGPVSGDVLPKAEETAALFESAGLLRRSVVEKDDLYWVEAEKPKR